MPLGELFLWVRVEDSRNLHSLEKPPIDVLFQIMLNYLAGKNAIREKGITFVNDEDIEDFVLGCAGDSGKNSVTISY